jgi:hypothetical protein
LSEETVVVICPNPNCGREIKEPILLAILSGTPRKEFEACPYCFTELKPEPKIEEESVSEPTFEPEEVLEDVDEPVTTISSESQVLEKTKASPSFFKKVRSLISRSNGEQKKDEIEDEEPQAESIATEEENIIIEETTPEPLVAEEPEEVQKVEPLVSEDPERLEEAPKIEEPEKKEAESSGCPDEFGYLANRPPNTSIPSQCLVCPKMVDCMLSERDD